MLVPFVHNARKGLCPFNRSPWLHSCREIV